VPGDIDACALFLPVEVDTTKTAPGAPRDGAAATVWGHHRFVAADYKLG
jgi:hypothetical protein